MDPAQLKANFEEQIATTEKQIKELEENLVKAKEYKIKLQGGLETLGLLEQEPEAPAEEAPAE
jgi:ferritin-like metal-binding protein YciE